MLIFLKLGGSLITNKNIPFSERKSTIKRLGMEIKQAVQKNPDFRLLIGHGSGSFGHAAAAQFGIHDGIRDKNGWIGFQKIWFAAHQLNQVIIEIFSKLDLPVVSLPASAALFSKNHAVEKWTTEPISTCLENQLLPVVFGDVVIDKKMGATIYSTEELFTYLAKILHPNRILLAGIEEGVYKDYPKCQDLLHIITPAMYSEISKKINGSASTDVTGGMASKVEKMLEIVENQNDISIYIFSGEKSGNLFKALSGQNMGTRLSV